MGLGDAPGRSGGRKAAWGMGAEEEWAKGNVDEESILNFHPSINIIVLLYSIAWNVNCTSMRGKK